MSASAQNQHTDNTRSDGLRAQFWRSAMGSAGVQAATVAVNFLLAVILARSLGPSGYGIYAYAFAIMTLLMVVAEVGVPTLMMREVAAADGRNEWGLMRGVIRRGLQLVAIGSVGISIAGLVLLAVISDRIEEVSAYTLALMLLVLPFAALTKTAGYALRGLQRVALALALETLLRSLLVTGIVIGILLLGAGFLTPYSAMAAQLIAVLVIALLSTVILRISLPPSVHTADPIYRSREWFSSTMPFILIGGALVINNQTDIVMLGWFTTPQEVGVYRVAVQGAALILFPVLVFQQVVGPRFARLYRANEIETLRLIDRKSRLFLIVVVACLFGIIAVFSKSLLELAFGVDFISAQVPLIVLGIGLLLNASCGASGTLMQMIGGEKFVSKLLWVTSLLNVLGNFLLIPYFGAAGAAFTTGLTTFLYQFALRIRANKLLEA